MIEWWAIFEYTSDRNAEQVRFETGERENKKAMLSRFDTAWKAKAIGKKKVVAMWVIDMATEQEDVLRAEGPCPGDINLRHAEYERRSKLP